MNTCEIKKNLAKKAIDLVQNNIILGLGTGSTLNEFLKELILKNEQKNLNLKIVASSAKTLNLASKGNLKIIDINDSPRIDLYIDGADEVDPKKNMIKGHGGALLREKIMLTNSSNVWILIDEEKLVDKLGLKKALPVEVSFFGCLVTKRQIEKLGLKSKIRVDKNGSFFVTDNGNFIIDVEFENGITKIMEIHQKLLNIAGVFETGLFFNQDNLNFMVGYK